MDKTMRPLATKQRPFCSNLISLQTFHYFCAYQSDVALRVTDKNQNCINQHRIPHLRHLLANKTDYIQAISFRMKPLDHVTSNRDELKGSRTIVYLISIAERSVYNAWIERYPECARLPDDRHAHFHAEEPRMNNNKNS
jgi:hypothetical protein